MKVYLISMIWVDEAVENIETITIDKNYKSEKDKTTDALIEDLF